MPWPNGGIISKVPVAIAPSRNSLRSDLSFITQLLRYKRSDFRQLKNENRIEVSSRRIFGYLCAYWPTKSSLGQLRSDLGTRSEMIVVSAEIEVLRRYIPILVSGNRSCK